jgi:hypothetical protein
MNPVTFNPINDSSIENIGFIAEELYDINPILSIIGPDHNYEVSNGDIKKLKELASDKQVPVGWDQTAVIGALVNAIKELNQKIEDLENKG